MLSASKPRRYCHLLGPDFLLKFSETIRNKHYPRKFPNDPMVGTLSVDKDATVDAWMGHPILLKTPLGTRRWRCPCGAEIHTTELEI